MAHLAVLFLVTIVYSTVHCQTDYCKLPCDTVVHTICQRKDFNCGGAPACGANFKAISLTNEDKQFILNVHNELRKRVATGKETIRNQPSSSNMKALNYNSELGSIAQCCTNTCTFNHDKCRRTASYSWVGQNLGLKSYSGTSGDYKIVMNSTIRAWYAEVKDFDPSWVSSFRSYDKTVGHYTQVVWAETKEVGCGMTTYVENGWYNFLFACNYGPGGNMAGSPVYKTGSPASDCSSGLSVNSKYPGLCGLDNIN
ncbi:unnamed protein product [Psylliodes chrysocephalus]|uniref:SCP domain-containing protein n=1 Tax=Psylliodes chrysocephalus TaxID=3402493 RepID=A0A9P0CT76_9CUCU|nr:unnamed protein product [Psylliodes chrysocephala]